MNERGTRGAYRKEDRVSLPPGLQKELVEKAAARYGNCQELAKRLDIPKSSVHYYLVGRLTMPVSVLEKMLAIADDKGLEEQIGEHGTTKDRLWAIEHAKSVFIDMCKERVRLPSREDLRLNDDLRRRTAALVSYVLAEGSVWILKEKWGEHAVNITFAEHETDLYRHFRSLCREVFRYDIGPAQRPGNNARAIRGFIYSRYVAETLVNLGVPVGDKASVESHMPDWVMESTDRATWVAALQPICDGEGCVSISSKQGLHGFSIAQSRHSDLDLWVLPRQVESKMTAKTLSLGVLQNRQIFGIPALDYCRLTARSGLLDDSAVLLRRLGLHPRVGLRSLYLKDDGFWSCNWGISFPKADIRSILEERLVTQDLKRYGLTLFTY
ncbi:MAG: hypothetical protein ABIE25_05810 [Thermoplasmatota archaeon]|nr:hypothetical protein [Candidatus Thermoplasmatota archaeon]